MPSVMNLFAEAVRRTQEHAEISSYELMRMIGERIGREISKKLTSDNFDDLLEEIADLFEKLDLGDAEIIRGRPAILKKTDCLACEKIPDTGVKVPCAFNEGLIKAIIDTKLKVKSTVKFLESGGGGYGQNYCKYEIKLE